MSELFDLRFELLNGASQLSQAAVSNDWKCVDVECPSGFDIDDLKRLLVASFGEAESDRASSIADMSTTLRVLWEALRAVEVTKGDIVKARRKCGKVDIPDATYTNFALGVFVGFAAGDGEMSGSDGGDVGMQSGKRICCSGVEVPPASANTFTDIINRLIQLNLAKIAFTHVWNGCNRNAGRFRVWQEHNVRCPGFRNIGDDVMS